MTKAMIEAATQRGRWIHKAGLLSIALGLAWTHVVFAQQHREGYLMHERDTGQTIYYYHIIEDSVVQIRQGTDETEPLLTLPPLVVRILNSELDRIAPVDSSEMERFELSYEDDRLTLNLAQRVDLLSYAFIFLLGVLGVILLVFRWRLKKERHRRDTLVESRYRLAEGREDERRRLAQELHDGPVQDLHALRMNLNVQRRRQTGVNGFEEELLHVIRELRAICEDLRPPALTPFGFGAALQAHIERFKKHHPDVHISSEITQDGQLLPERVRLALFRICQEALNNAVQHAKASHLVVRFGLEEGKLTLEVRDNGVGFTVPDEWITLAKDEHYGLLGMGERAESIGATLEVVSKPGEGTRVEVILPIRLDHAPETVLDVIVEE